MRMKGFCVFQKRFPLTKLLKARILEKSLAGGAGVAAGAAGAEGGGSAADAVGKCWLTLMAGITGGD